MKFFFTKSITPGMDPEIILQNFWWWTLAFLIRKTPKKVVLVKYEERDEIELSRWNKIIIKLSYHLQEHDPVAGFAWIKPNYVVSDY